MSAFQSYEYKGRKHQFSGVVTLCAPRARARAVFGPDKCKDLCGHAQFLLRNVPEKDFETGARPVSKT